MDTVESKISNLIETQFPAEYRQNGPVFVAFVTEYYKWLEQQNNILYHTRNLYAYNDIDTTVEQFLVYFKETYLKNIQFNTNTNIPQLIKHSLDIYRSRGTERAIDLLFRLVFGAGAEVYYPSQDIFRLSDGGWYKPRYLEVTLNDKTSLFSNRQIVGLKSGAKAFVEKVIRRTVNGKLIDVLYISAIVGNFQTDEVIIVDGVSDVNDERIRIIGSLSSIAIPEEGIGARFSIGDIVDLVSSRGRQGKGRVTSINDIIGLVNFTLENGGWGYTANAQVLISEKVLLINNLSTSSNNKTSDYFKILTPFIQPRATIEYNTLTGIDEFVVGSLIYNYHPNNDVKGTGRIINTSPNTVSTGNIHISILEGLFEDEDVFYTTANAASAEINVGGYVDFTVTSNLMATSSNLEITLVNPIGQYNRNEIVYVSNGSVNTAIGTVFSYSTLLNKGILKIVDRTGIFRNNDVVSGEETGASGTIENIAMTIGVIDITGNTTYTTLNGNYVYSPTYNTQGTIAIIGEGTGADFEISPDLLYTQNIFINDDFILPKANVSLNATSYGFVSNLTANLTNCTIAEALHMANKDVGKIQTLVSINHGRDYTYPPFVKIFEPIIYAYKKRDYILEVSSISGNFTIGERIIQGNTNGIIKEGSNSSVLYVERLNFTNTTNFIITTNTETKILGISSNTSANVDMVISNKNTAPIGINAVIDNQTTIETGAVTSMDIYDSGFGYIDGERTDFENDFGIASAFAVVEKAGFGQGFYENNNGFLSDDKKLFDGWYYQDFSYEVRSSVTLDKYADMLKKVLHVAGTKSFAAFVFKSIVEKTIGIVEDDTGGSAIITIGTNPVLETEDETQIIETNDNQMIVVN